MKREAAHQLLIEDVRTAPPGPNDALLEDGCVVLREDGHIDRIAPASGETRLSYERIAFMNKRIDSNTARTSELLETQWIATFAEATAVVAEANGQAGWMAEASFWTRLYGALVDLRNKFNEWGRTLDRLELTTSEISRLPPEHRVARAFACRSSLNALYDVFSREELIFIDYLRHSSCHPFQSGYALQWREKPGEEVTFYRPKTLPDACAKDECSEALSRVHAKFARNGPLCENLVAVEFAKRVQPLLPDLRASFGAAPDGSPMPGW